jgi:hypothetical protein
MVLNKDRDLSVRDYLSGRLRLASIATVIAWAGFGLSSVASSKGVDWAVGLQLPFLGLFGLTIICHGFAFRCPRCRGSLGHTLQRGHNPWRVGRRVRYCPYCALDFDLARMAAFSK